jgi:hypothetical protein
VTPVPLLFVKSIRMEGERDSLEAMLGRSLLLGNCIFRFSYGVVALVAPSTSARARLVPDTEERPDARLFIRGFGSHQVVVAAVGLASLRWAQLERPALELAAAIDLADVASALIEARARGRLDDDLVGGVAFSLAGLATAAAALRTTSRV